ncbi:HEAT repeat domain-containing protein [Algoriphagus aquimarinus]|uniref:HEAT repeat domain-containing protein n=1 Tax=Algoriphagus aquimarinus TaxID=237018 RepID=A0A5C7B0S4_9BACT|nr:HEAT repeat domain-containing protein [Algoriphagus aquimarinus]TXE14448.1 HEAT repeat domain-containing protein [Algoriphagus aquimarinus]|tara:strand:- start:1109 stop:1597 length:489 start_codon:yes stop_codon:yes gene_type:complete
MAKSNSNTAVQDFDAQELLAFLRQDELDYPAGAKKFGKTALPFLAELVQGADENLSIKAAYLVGYIDDEAGNDILEMAAEKGSAPVRIAAAFSAQKRSAKAAEAILNKSLDDSDPSVVKFALRSASAMKMENIFKTKIDKISKTFHNDEIKMNALNVMKKLK